MSVEPSRSGNGEQQPQDLQELLHSKAAQHVHDLRGSELILPPFHSQMTNELNLVAAPVAAVQMLIEIVETCSIAFDERLSSPRFELKAQSENESDIKAQIDNYIFLRDECNRVLNDCANLLP